MLFNSYIFLLLFLPLTLVLYFIFNKMHLYNIAMIELIIASFVFYMYDNPKFGLLLASSILINYSLSYYLNRISSAYRGGVLIVGIILNLSTIFYFKYFNFFLINISNVIGKQWELRNIILPLGISFYTFQQISYLIDSYHGETKNYKFLEYAAFVSFFPQLVAGPIVLHDEIIYQFRDKEKKIFNNESFANGLYILAVGLFKKILVADTLGKAVAWGYSNTDILSSSEIVIIMLSYTMQIYFDFSGYCDMAIGIGKMFNIELPINFNSPYKSCSIIEFWKRWHCTLTRFLRKYVYFPLGGSKKGTARTYINILVVFLISGIWHGANWTFILWGMIHGVANVLNRIFKTKWDNLHTVLQWMINFVFINITWLIFRSNSITQAFDLIKRMISFKTLTVHEELLKCFMFEDELQFILKSYFADTNSRLYLIQSKIWDSFSSGIYMVYFIIACFIACLGLKNLHEKKFVPTYSKALITIGLFIWSIISLSGVSTFLYFNF